MSNASNNLQNLFQSCILSEPSKRLKREYVRFKIIEEIDVFIQKQDNNISSNQDQIAQFIYEFILILQNYPKLIKTINRNLDNFGYLIKRHLYPTPDLKKTYDKIYSDIDIFLFSELKDSESLFRLSSFSIKKFKSLKYLILAADQNHIQAQCNLGNKSIYYLRLAADQNHIEAQFTLGKIYNDILFSKQNINESIYYLTLAANQNHSEAQCRLGKIYYEGKYLKQNIEKSIYYFTLSSNQNNNIALINLAIFYFEGKYTPADINKSIYSFTLVANEKNPIAYHYLSYIYYNDKYIQPNITKATYYLNYLAYKNDLNAMYRLAKLSYKSRYSKQNLSKSFFYLDLIALSNYKYHNIYLKYYSDDLISSELKTFIKNYTSLCVCIQTKVRFILGKLYYEDIPINRYINIQKSIYYLSQSAASNHLKSQFLLGKIYYEGKYIARNMNLSIYYFTQASKQNDPDSQYYLGMIYYEGIFVPRDINKSIHYLELSVNQNDINAQNNLGIIYYEDNYIPRNIVKSIYYFTLAASNGDNVAQHNLGKIYYERIYVERDIDKAIHFFYLSAKKNNPTALYNLGVIYYEGIYCLRDIDKAIYFLEKSSKLNFSLAQYQLGLILLNERSVQNLNRGIIYIRLSAENHNHEAEVILGDLFFEGKYFEYDLEKAIHFYKEASCFYNQYAKNNLGVIYKNGFDRIEKNIPLAKEYFNEAIKQKHDAISMYNLANILIEEEDFKTEKTESIKLLIDSASQGFGPSTKLLCFVFIQKFSQIDFEIINNELQKYGNKSNKFVTYILQNCQKIQLLMSNKMFFLKKEYDNLRESNYVYLIKNIKKLDEMKKDRYLYIKAKAKIKEINELFYEGLGNLTL